MAKKLARIDGRIVSQPTVNTGDTVFTVLGPSYWRGSKSKYEVHLKGPESYYKYNELRDAGKNWEGDTVQEQVEVTGNNPDRILRYRNYILTLKGSDYKTWWQDLLDNFKLK